MPTLGLLLKYQPKQPKTEVCYAVGNDACDSIVGSRNCWTSGKKGKQSFSYGRFLTGISVKIAKSPIRFSLLHMYRHRWFPDRSCHPDQDEENEFIPWDIRAKINIDKVTRIMGAASTADFYVKGGRLTDSIR